MVEVKVEKTEKGFRKRETAVRLFAFEINATKHLEGDVPKYAVTPLGRKVNRIFFVGALLDKTETRPESNVWKLRIADPTGAVRVYASRFQPEALEKVVELEPPTLVAVVGKLRVIDVNGTKVPIIRPESINEVDKSVRDYWLFETVKETRERIKKFNEVKERVTELYGEVDVNEFTKKVQEVVEILREEYVLEGVKNESEDEKEIDKAVEEELEEEFEEPKDAFEEFEIDMSEILDEQ